MSTAVNIKDETEFIALLKSGSDKAFIKLYENYSNSLYGVIYKVVADEEIAQDVLQECFVRIWKNLDNYDANKGRLFTWLLNIARNAAIDTIRSKSFNQSKANQNLNENVNSYDRQNSYTIGEDKIAFKIQNINNFFILRT